MLATFKHIPEGVTPLPKNVECRRYRHGRLTFYFVRVALPDSPEPTEVLVTRVYVFIESFCVRLYRFREFPKNEAVPEVQIEAIKAWLLHHEPPGGRRFVEDVPQMLPANRLGGELESFPDKTGSLASLPTRVARAAQALREPDMQSVREDDSEGLLRKAVVLFEIEMWCESIEAATAKVAGGW